MAGYKNTELYEKQGFDFSSKKKQNRLSRDVNYKIRKKYLRIHLFWCVFPMYSDRCHYIFAIFTKKNKKLYKIVLTIYT